jgi:metal-sulfur cluster biosynthetic enzyme
LAWALNPNALFGLMLALSRVGEITVNMVFTPPWDRSMMSEAAQLALGL